MGRCIWAEILLETTWFEHTFCLLFSILSLSDSLIPLQLSVSLSLSLPPFLVLCQSRPPNMREIISQKWPCYTSPRAKKPAHKCKRAEQTRIIGWLNGSSQSFCDENGDFPSCLSCISARLLVMWWHGGTIHKHTPFAVVSQLSLHSAQDSSLRYNVI